MAQRRKREVIKEIESVSLDDRHPSDMKALERIRFDISDWDKMNWFVAIANKDLPAMTPGELQMLREEVVAIKRALRLSWGKTTWDPSLERAKETHRAVSKHLKELAETGQTTLGPFEQQTHIQSADVAFKDVFSELDSDTKQSLSGFSHHTKITEGDELLFFMSRLLEQFGGSIRRCPHCSIIFLQSRRNAVYCSRKCQSVAVMRAKRSDESRETKSKRTKKVKKKTRP